MSTFQRASFRVTAHTMRHSAATLRAEAGADVEDLRRYMGWRTLQTALDYIHRAPRHALERISQHRPPIRAVALEDRV